MRVIGGGMLLLLFLYPAGLRAQDHSVTADDGVVVPARSWDISAEVSNKISKLHFVRGQEVQEGDLLVEFDTYFKTLEVERAALALERAEAEKAEADEVLARQATLKDRDVASTARLREAEIAAAIADTNVREAKIALDMARTILDAQKLYAPFDGQMSAPRYRENANVDISDGTEIATLVQLDPIHVVFKEAFTDAYLDHLQAGRGFSELAERYRAVLILPNGETYPHEGRAVSAAFDIETQTGLATGLLEFANPDGVLRPGLKVKVVDRWTE